MQISIWYPARTGQQNSYMPYAQYVYLSARELDFKPLTNQKKNQATKEFFDGPLKTGASRRQLEILMKTETAAIRSARAAGGHFPLVIFAHSSPPFQSIMCEYLASHGFVVAAVPSKGSFGYDFDVGLSGLETIIRDMEFVFTHAAQLPHVDERKLGLIGMSFGSAAVVGFHTRHPSVGAMISLDGGIGERGVSNLLTRTPYYDANRIKAPLLHLYTPNNPHLDMTRIESFSQSTRYFVTIPRMRHGDFVAYAMLERVAPQMFGDAPADARAGYEWLCRYTLRFLEAYLNQNHHAMQFLSREPEKNGVAPELLTVHVLNKQ